MDHSKDKHIKKLQYEKELLTETLERKLWHSQENQDKLSSTDHAALMYRSELLDDII